MFYADLVQEGDGHRIYITVEASSLAVAVAMCDAYATGYFVGRGTKLTLENVTSSKPRGKTYFKFSDADAIRRGLKI